jgi:hypothetical protein
MKEVFRVQGWTSKITKKGPVMPYNNEQFFFDIESANESFDSEKNRVQFELQCSRGLKGFVTLKSCVGNKGKIWSGEELKRIEL